MLFVCLSVCISCGHVTSSCLFVCLSICISYGHVTTSCLFEVFEGLMKAHMNDAAILAMVAKSQEFEQIKVCVIVYVCLFVCVCV